MMGLIRPMDVWQLRGSILHIECCVGRVGIVIRILLIFVLMMCFRDWVTLLLDEMVSW
jgi:hypothetical protein